MKYYLKPHVTDEMLQAVGFEILTNSWGHKFASRGNGDKELFIALNEKCDFTFGLRYVEFAYKFFNNYSVRNYIQDLIKLEYVLEVR